MTKGQTIAADVSALLRARNSLLWIVTREEARVERYLFEAAKSANYVPHTWDVAQGVADMDGKPEGSMANANDPDAVLNIIRSRADAQKGERGVWMLRDFPAWITGPAGVSTLRKVRNLARLLPGIGRDNAQAMIILSPSGDVPPELAGHTTVIEWPLPDREEIAAVLDAAIGSLPDDIRKTAAPNGTRDAAIDAAVGLNGEEAAACFARSLVQSRKIDPLLISKEKRRVIARERVLEWFEPLPGGLDAVGGLGNLKTWLLGRSLAFSPKARAFGLPFPKGILLVGPPGCGKSLTPKAISTAWGWPLLRVDLGALKSKFVGDSERNLRTVFSVIGAMGRCVVWFDEIEKSLQGATSGSADGGVSSDALGAILSWMQERQGEAFVIATANDVSVLPPELLRKGRFDEVFWIDLPTQSERVEILNATLRTFGRAKIGNADGVAATCQGFTGSEIAAIVPDALFAAFADGEREITSDDLIDAAKTVVPLSETAKEKITKLREWAKGRARPATAPDATADRPASSSRNLDI